MKLLLTALGCIAAFAVQAGDWREELTLTPGTFPPLRPLTADYEFGWSGVTAANAKAKFSVSETQNELYLTVGTMGMARKMWKMDSRATSVCDSLTLAPISLVQVEEYSDETRTTKVDFTEKGAERFRVSTPPDKTPPKIKKFKLKEIHDMQSALLFFRSQPLVAGDKVKLCVYPGSSGYFAVIEVLGREKITVAGKEWNAIKCDLKLREVDKKFVLKTHDKFKNAIAWFSDDQDRMLLKIEAEVFIGKVWTELKKVEFLDEKK